MASKRNSSSKPIPKGYVEDNSKGPMLRFQASLPQLPVPTLQETADRYVKSLRALYPAEDVAKSEAAVREFIRPGGVGERLQAKLLTKREDPAVKNWLYEWWNDAAYLTYRDPVVPYVSYFYSHRDDRRRRDPAKRAAALTTAALAFRHLVVSGTLEPEYMKGLPLCMDSYQFMFHCDRIPARPKDYAAQHDPAAPAHQHIVVVRQNRFFKLQYEVDGRTLNTRELEAQFRRVYEMATTASSPAPPVGFLTTENRDVWTDARAALEAASPVNAETLAAIDSAAFVVCLDDAAPVTLEERAHQYWHGNGSNRWLDKPLQFIVNDNGTSGFMGEHSMMDGTPTHRLNDWVCDAIVNNKLEALSDTRARTNLPEPVALEFRLTEPLAATVAAAGAHFADVMGRHQLAVQAYQGYGKGLIKKFRCSPDAYVQMIIQLAYFKMFGKNRPTYESAATRRFQLGRTETCRSVSEASVAFCRAMGADSDVDAATRQTLFRAAVDAHVAYISAASDGKGVDRHLFGLRKLLEPGEPVPALYADPAFAYSSKWFLSTSQLSSEFFNGYGWSQVVDEGFGIAYMINENSLNFNIVSKGLGSDRMSFYLDEAAGDIRDLLLPTLETKAKL